MRNLGWLKEKGLEIVIINFGQPADTIKIIYKRKAPELTIIVDESSEISREKFGVTAVSFFYVLYEKSKVVERKPYTPAAARACSTLSAVSVLK